VELKGLSVDYFSSNFADLEDLHTYVAILGKVLDFNQCLVRHAVASKASTRYLCASPSSSHELQWNRHVQPRLTVVLP